MLNILYFLPLRSWPKSKPHVTEIKSLILHKYLGIKIWIPENLNIYTKKKEQYSNPWGYELPVTLEYMQASYHSESNLSRRIWNPSTSTNMSQLYIPFSLWSKYSSMTRMIWTIARIRDPKANEPVWYLPGWGEMIRKSRLVESLQHLWAFSWRK